MLQASRPKDLFDRKETSSKKHKRSRFAAFNMFGL
jgi:hypothetical protein